jgi:hypothetical protein
MLNFLSRLNSFVSRAQVQITCDLILIASGLFFLSEIKSTAPEVFWIRFLINCSLVLLSLFILIRDLRRLRSGYTTPR